MLGQDCPLAATDEMCIRDRSCYGPRSSICVYVLGAGYPELDYATEFPEKRYDDPDYVLPKVALIIGKDPLVSNPDGLFGHALVDMMKRGTELIVVDPRATWLATRAKYFLQLRPGTDAALYLSCLLYTSGLVGDQQLGVAGQRHGDHDALAHAARHLVRVVVDALFGRGDAHLAQQVDGAFARLLLADLLVGADGFHDLVPNAVHRIERRHGLLEDHGHVAVSYTHLE